MNSGKQVKTKVLFFGLGSIGKRHARLLKENPNIALYAFRSDKDSAKNNMGIKEFDSLEKALAIKPDVAFVTNPTSIHVPTALQCAEKGINLFIESPIGSSLQGLDKLEELVKKNDLFTYVAYNLRFHPIAVYLKQFVKERGKPKEFRAVSSSYLPNWRSGQEYTQSYSTKKELGGGVVLDMSHEFDYIAWLFEGIKKIDGKCGKESKLRMDCEDFADATITCKNGTKGKLHLDCHSVKAVRKIEMFYEGEYIEGDLLHNTVQIKRKDGTEELKEFNVKADDTYRKQLKYFFEKFHNKDENHMNSLPKAVKTFRKIIEFKEACG